MVKSSEKERRISNNVHLVDIVQDYSGNKRRSTALKRGQTLETNGMSTRLAREGNGKPKPYFQSLCLPMYLSRNLNHDPS